MVTRHQVKASAAAPGDARAAAVVRVGLGARAAVVVAGAAVGARDAAATERGVADVAGAVEDTAVEVAAEAQLVASQALGHRAMDTRRRGRRGGG